MALNFLYAIDPETMVLGLLFLIFLAVTNFSLGRFFKKSKTTATIIAFCVSLLAVYGINRTTWDVPEFFYGIGLSENLLYIIVPIAALIFLFLLSRKKNPETDKRRFSLARFLMILGALLIISALANLFYEKGVMIAAGIGLLVLGLIIRYRKKIKFKKKR